MTRVERGLKRSGWSKVREKPDGESMWVDILKNPYLKKCKINFKEVF